MKKSKIILLTLTLTILAMAICACTLLPIADSITIVKYPATSYVQGAELNYNDITVRLNNGDEITLTQAIAAGVTVKNFSTEKIGSFTAIIEYQGYQVMFNYSVVPVTNNFAGGNGTESDPYLISTAEQWNKIDETLIANANNCYFELINDIDFKGVEIKQIGYLIGNDNCTFRKIILNGNGYSLRNIDTMIIEENQPSKYVGVMNTANGSIIKNLNIFYASEGVNRANAFVYSIEANENDYSLIFENVNTYGYINTNGPTQSSSSVSGFVARANDVRNIKFIKCNNYTNIIGGAAHYCGGFIALGNQTKSYFENCNNYGNIEGAFKYNAGFIGIYPGNSKLEGTNANYGNITQIEVAAQIFPGRMTDENTDKGKINTITSLVAKDGKINISENDKLKSANFVMLITYGYTGGSGYRAVENLHKNATNTEVTYTKYTSLTVIESGFIEENYDVVNAEQFMYRNGTDLFVDAENHIVTRDASFLGWNLYIYAYDTNGVLIGYVKLDK